MFIIVAFGNFFQIFKKILLKFAEVAPVGAWIEILKYMKKSQKEF